MLGYLKQIQDFLSFHLKILEYLSPEDIYSFFLFLSVTAVSLHLKNFNIFLPKIILWVLEFLWLSQFFPFVWIGIQIIAYIASGLYIFQVSFNLKFPHLKKKNLTIYWKDWVIYLLKRLFFWKSCIFWRTCYVLGFADCIPVVSLNIIFCPCISCL